MLLRLRELLRGLRLLRRVLRVLLLLKRVLLPLKMIRSSIGVLVFFFPLLAAAQQDGLVHVRIQSIRVQGSRLPAASIIKLLELKAGQEANEKTISLGN